MKAIIFDCFGVLTTDGWLPFKRRHFGHDQSLHDEASDLNKRSDRGMISDNDFVEGIAKLAGVPEHEVTKATEGNQPNEELLEYIAQLKPRYRIGLLSNTSSDRLSQLFTSKQLALFDETVLSYDTGIVKPDERAYGIIAERLGVDPSECVFIDDQERLCTGAREAGMQAIQYQDFEQLKRDLEKLLG